MSYAAFVVMVLRSVLAAGDEPRPVAFDWITTGPDCKLYAAGDINGDGFADVVTVNGGRDLCVSLSVNGWKASNWAGVASDVNPDAPGLAVADVDSTAAGNEIVLIEKDRVFVFSKFVDGKMTERKEVGMPAPDGKVFGLKDKDRVVLFGLSKDKLWSLRDGNFEVRSTPPEPSGEFFELPIATGKALSPGIEMPIEFGRTFLPPYDLQAKLMVLLEADFNHDGVRDSCWVLDSSKPHDHHVLRVSLSRNLESNDQDSDGLTDDEERALGTDTYNRDTDGDGLLDGWEVHGLPRGIELGELIKTYTKDAAGAEKPAADRDVQLNPMRQDVIVAVSYFEGVDPKQFAAEMPKVQAVYQKVTNVNPDGSHGIWVHFRVLPGFVPKAEQSMPWWDIGNKYFAKRERGLMHWLQVTPWGGGQSSETGDMGGAGNNWQVFSHEFGHQMSLSHSGDSEPAWCPLYPSMMSYAFSYSLDGDGNAVRFSNGDFRETVLDERHLVEKLPYAYEKLKYLANWPFRFTLKDNGDGTTLIDWNHNGKFDEGEVEADINYGGSTYCGTRREHEAVGSAGALAYVGNTAILAALDQTKDHVWVKSYLGNEKWSEKKDIANTGSESDPVLVGGKDYGLLLHRHLYGWRATKIERKPVAAPTQAEQVQKPGEKPAVNAVPAPSGVEETVVGAPVQLPEVPSAELNACRVGDRVLIVSRHDNDELEARWLTFKDNDASKPVVSAAVKLETRSLVTPGIAVDPADGRIVMVTSMNNSRGSPFCMRVTWMKVQGDRLFEQETRWTRGEGSGNGCCSRPVVAFTNSGQLNIFHQGGPDDSGQKIAYRTSRVGNEKLDEGWLTCMLYDVWTKSRVPVGFANGAQGAIFAYRWDSGGPHVNWLATAHDGFGIDRQPMRDFDDGEKMSKWGIRHSILLMNAE